MCALVLAGFSGCWMDWLVEGDCPANATYAIFLGLEKHRAFPAITICGLPKKFPAGLSNTA